MLAKSVACRMADFKVFFKIVLCGSKMQSSPFYALGGYDPVLRLIGSYLALPVPSCFLQAAANMGFRVFRPYSRKKYRFFIEEKKEL